MKPLNHFMIINIILSLFFYFGLAAFTSCPNADKNCYYLNELLAPCSHGFDFSYIYNFGNYSVHVPFWQSVNCVCSKEYYDTLVACGQLCKFNVDPPIKYESECKIAKKPVNLGVINPTTAALIIQNEPCNKLRQVNANNIFNQFLKKHHAADFDNKHLKMLSVSIWIETVIMIKTG
ncbi:hypothetical protein C1646_770527 [Rhizophagus diaphanus]|nr:hypothetical protein C1646_770527 [Rhizophagus diaphanus] [Rhizophagus sp. MUCL 43196]